MRNASRYTILNYRYLIGIVLFALIGIGGSLFIPYVFIQEADIFVPIVAEKVPKGLIVADMPFKGIEVHVRCLKTITKVLPRLKINYVLDLSKADIGVNTIPIRKALVPFPKGVSILKINPDIITVRIEKEVTKNLPIRISLAGKPAKGFEVVGTRAEPASVLLRGSIEALGPMDYVSTKQLNITGQTSSFKKKGPAHESACPPARLHLRRHAVRRAARSGPARERRVPRERRRRIPQLGRRRQCGGARHPDLSRADRLLHSN